MTTHGLDAPDILTDGAWQHDGRGVRRWVPAPPPEPAHPNLALLIACPFCRATITETCRSRNGRRRCEPHSTRLVRARRCKCGGHLAQRTRKPSLLCEECRADARRETWRLSKRRERAGRAA